MLEGVIARIHLKAKALLPVDWFGRAGRRLRLTTEAISAYSEENDLTLPALAKEGVELARLKVEGLAMSEHAQAVKAYTEEEGKKIANVLEKRTIEFKIRQEQAKALDMEAAAERSRVQTEAEKLRLIDATVDLLSKLRARGLAVTVDKHSNKWGLHISKASSSADWAAVEQKVLDLLLSDEALAQDQPLVCAIGASETKSRISITASAWNVMVNEAQTAYPTECCGAMIGRVDGTAKVVLKAEPLTNTIREKYRYELKPEDLVNADRRAREEGLDIVGVYHSRPDADAFFSKVDLLNSCPWYSWVVLSIREGKFDHACSWLPNFEQTKAEQEELIYL